MKMRWWIFAFLFAFTFVAYPQRLAVSVAAERMMPELGLSQGQIGWLETAFLISYTALQIPGGILGQRLGPRLMLTLCGGIAVAATLAVPLLPFVFGGASLIAGLLAAQLVLGAMQAPVFPLVAGGLERWFPSRQWALTQGLTSCGIGLGSAAAPAVIASLMVLVGWRDALVLVALPVASLVAFWWWQGRDTPYQHPLVAPDELADLDYAEPATGTVTWARAAMLLTNRNLLGLTLSYLLMNVVFYLITLWSFLYLVQARHFSLLEGGLAASLPPLAGALGAALGGFGGSHCTARFGARRGLRIVPLITLPASGVLLLSVQAESAAWALAGLALSFGLLEMNEAPFWAASMEIGREDAASAGAVLNTGGNLGGIIATPVVAYLSGLGNWSLPFMLGAGCAVASAALWLVVAPVPVRQAERVHGNR
ncbi:MAG: MFS transporter [Rhodospirillales bacterium]